MHELSFKPERTAKNAAWTFAGSIFLALSACSGNNLSLDDDPESGDQTTVLLPGDPATDANNGNPPIIQPPIDQPVIDSNVDEPLADSGQPGIDVIIPRISPDQAPVMDGAGIVYRSDAIVLGGEWASAVQNDVAGNRLAIDTKMIDLSGSSTEVPNHHWAAMHDGKYLYLLVISDDAGQHITDSQNPRKLWQDDDLEIYFDGNNSKLNDFDGVDDFQIHINLLEPTEGQANSSTIASARYGTSVASAPLPNDFVFVTGPRAGPLSPRVSAGLQDVYEVRIKISELNITIGQPIGIEFQINDDDNGGDRDAKWGWKHPIGIPGADDLTWENPSLMGTAVLSN